MGIFGKIDTSSFSAELSPSALASAQQQATQSALNQSKKGLLSTIGAGAGNFISQYGGMISDIGNSVLGLQSRSQMYGGWRGAAKDMNQQVMEKVNPLAGTVNRLSDTVSGGIAKAFGMSTDYDDGASQTFDTVTDALNYLGPWGMAANFALDTVNALTGTTVKGVQQSERVGASSSYGSVSSDMEKNAADQTIGGFGRLMGSARKRRRQIARIQDRVNRTENLLERADDRKQASQWQGYGLRNWMELNGNPSPTHLAKQGMKLPNKTDITNIKAILSKKSGGTLLPPKPEFYSILAEELEEEVEAFKQGGTIIPEGALHARKNNMEGAGKDFTHKGIPVVDNKGEQQAEIERDEIIFSKEVTSKLEELMNDGSDKAAIEAGKLLVKEIFENTDDRTGLIAAIVGEEPTPDEEDFAKFGEGGTVEIAKEGTKTPEKEEDTISLEDFMSEKIKSRTEAAIQKATTRKTPYMFKNKDWKNCIATAVDNYGIPIVMRNADLAADPGKYGFEEIFFGDNTDTLPDGVLIQDYNKENDPDTPGHTVMLVGRTETGAPLYSYSNGDNTPEAMHRSTTNYTFRRWDNKRKPRAYRYIGTPAERWAWTEEYNTLYPVKHD